MKVLIACGGTGGHLFPGVAVAETLVARGHQVRLLVSEKAVDQAALSAWTRSSTASAISVRALGAVGYSGSRGLIRFCARFAQALTECRRQYGEFEPEAVLGMGGFTSAPALLAARGRAKLIHESNAVPGKANRWSGKVADHIAVGLADCAKFFGHKPVTVTGTPIRQALRQGRVTGARAQLGLADDRRTVLVMGGSQGARAINVALLGALPGLVTRKEQIQFVHLSGPADEASVAGGLFHRFRESGGMAAGPLRGVDANRLTRARPPRATRPRRTSRSGTRRAAPAHYRATLSYAPASIPSMVTVDPTISPSFPPRSCNRCAS